MPAAREPLAMIAALTPSRVIGKNGGIPWHHSEDMKHFRRVTTGHALIVGRATYDSIGRPLPNRRNIVISRDAQLHIEGCEVVGTLHAAIALARQTDREPMIGGGGQIYAQALPLATRLYLTYLDAEHEGDVLFPEIDAGEWIETERRAGEGLTWVTLERKP